MAQTGYTPILIYSSSTASQAPAAGNLTNSTLGSELAININDGKLFYKDSSNNVQVIGWKTVPTTAGGTGLTSYTAGDLVYYASGTAFTKLAIGATGRWLGSSGTAPQWNAPAALTSTDDTNVTLTLGGSASTALLNAASLTLGWTGQLAVTRGGTGLATVAQGDILYGSASNTLSALAKNTTATRYLSNTGTSNNPAWAQVNLTNGVTGTLPVGNGGTGTGTAFTAGSVLFAGASGVYSQDNAQFFWDDTNNRLALGQSSATYQLDILSALTGTAAGDNTLLMLSSAASGRDANIRFGDGTNASARIGYLSGDMYFYVSGQERVRFTTGSVAQFFKNATTVNSYVDVFHALNSTNGSSFVNFRYDGTSIGDIAQDGTAAVKYNTTSDYRLKSNVRPMDGGLEKLLQLKPVVFNWADGRDGQGFIAHELQSVIPDAVTGQKDAVDEDGNAKYQSVDLTRVIATLTLALQELKKEFDALKAQITA